MGYNEKAILLTLTYYDLFDYPLTREELWKYATSKHRLTKKEYVAKLKEDSSIFTVEKQFYFLKYREKIVTLRLSRQLIAHKKIIIAHKMSRILSFIPTIYFIGISGSVSMMNTKEEDDIDFFIITKNKTLWITRLLIHLLLQVSGRRRKKYEKKARDKICVNMFMDESALAFPKEQQDVYIAHEIVQIKPIFQRNNTYKTFISNNEWVKEFMPNVSDVSKYQSLMVSNRNNYVTRLVCCCLTAFNAIAKKAQLWYMKNNKASGIITDKLVAFYESSTHEHVLKMYKQKIKQYEI